MFIANKIFTKRLKILSKKNSIIINMDKKSYNLFLYTILIFFMYTYQGLLYGLVSSIKIFLTKKGVPINQLSIYETIQIPVYTKFLFSPLLDLIYYKPIGKRMTYILSISIFFTFYYYYLALNMDSWMESLEVYKIIFSLLLSMFMVSI